VNYLLVLGNTDAITCTFRMQNPDHCNYLVAVRPEWSHERVCLAAWTRYVNLYNWFFCPHASLKAVWSNRFLNMSATFCIVHCTKRPLNEPVLAIKSVMQLHGTLETLNNDKYYCLTHVPSPQNANLVMGARTSYMRLTGSCVEPFNCGKLTTWSDNVFG